MVFVSSLLPILFSIACPQSPAGPNGPNTAEWSIAAGGNGHRYEPVIAAAPISWHDAQHAAQAAGGTLATLTSAAENAFVFSLIDAPAYWRAAGPNNFGPWIGAFQPPAGAEPNGGWTWVTGEPFALTSWRSGQPDESGCGVEDFTLFWTATPPLRAPEWADFSDGTRCGGGGVSFVVEYEPSLCGAGGVAATTGGPFAVGNSSFAFSVGGADPTATLMLILGAPERTLACGGPCVLTYPIILSIETNVGGSASRNLAVPNDPSLVGIALEQQWASLSPSGSSCPNIPGLSASQRLVVMVTS